MQRLNSIVTLVNAMNTAEELTSQLRSAGAKALFTCASLLSPAIKAADIVGIPRQHIFLLELATDQPNHGSKQRQNWLPEVRASLHKSQLGGHPAKQKCK